MPHFSRKMVLYLLRKFGIFKPPTNIQLFRRFYLSFWKTLKQIYRKLQYEEKFFEKFQGLPCFPRKMGLHLLTKLYIFELCINICSLRRLYLGFDNFIDNPNVGRNFLKSSGWASLPQKIGFVFVDQIWHYKAMYQYSSTQKIRCRLLIFTFTIWELLLVFHV